MNLHQHTKNQAIASFCSEDLVNLKVLEFDWLRAFGLHLKTQVILRYGIGFVQEHDK